MPIKIFVRILILVCALARTDAPPEPEKSAWGDVPTWLLVIVGGVAAWIALRTLDDIKKQTINATKAADAAEKSANALIASERAWVMAFAEHESVRIKITLSSNGDEDSTLAFVLSYQNEGKSPCWITEKRVWFAIVDSIPPSPVFENPTKRFTATEPLFVKAKNVLRVNDATCKGIHTVRLSTVPTTEKLTENHPIFYGVIKYRDAFGSNYETRFGYLVRRDMSFERIPSSAYNNNL